MKPVDAERKLVAILAADVEGYSRLMGSDEVGTLRDLTQRRTILDSLIAAHRGRIANTAGDSVLAEFGSAVDAVQCAVESQAALAVANADRSPDRHINFRIGVHVGDVMVKDGDLFGDGVNIAGRLEGIAEPGGVCISDDAYRQVRGKVEIVCDDMGPQSLKNIAEPTRAWRVRLTGQTPSAVRSGSAVSQSQALSLPDKPSIAVLPFRNMSDDPEQEYFADGIVEDIVTALCRMRWLFVIAHNSTFTYKGRAVDVRQVGRELGVRYVLEGSVRKAGSRVRITGQLIDVSTGAHLWADRFDGALEDIFDLQDEITERAVAALAPELYAAEGIRAKRKPPQSLDAWECVVRALSLINTRTKENITVAQELLQKAIALDSSYARAYSLLAYTTAMGMHYGWRSRESAMPLALDSAYKAVHLDGDEPWAHFALGNALTYSGRAREGVVEEERALALNPNFAYAFTALGFALCYLDDRFHETCIMEPMG